MTEFFPARWRAPGRRETVPTPPLMWKLLGVDVSPDDPRIRVLRSALLESDPAGDALAEWISEEPNGRRLFDVALERGIAELSDPPSALRDFFADVDRVPAWLDRRLVALGAETMLRIGRGAHYALGGASLMSGYLSSGAVKPLVMTGALTKMARRRVAETAKFVRDLATSGPLARSSDGFKTTVRVRLMHALVRRSLSLSPHWQRDAWGVPINQRDMVGTHLEFTVVWMAGVMTLGYWLSEGEREAVIHLWRYVGTLLGIREELLPTSFHQALETTWMFNRTEVGPDDDGRALAAALVEAWSEGLPGSRFGKIEGRFITGYSRFFIGRHGADALGLPRTVWRHAPLFIAPLTIARETFRRLAPGGRARAVRSGRIYFDALLAHALEGRPPDFQPYRGLHP